MAGTGLAGVRPRAFRDEMLDVQFLRALAYEAYGGAVVGECYLAASRARGRGFDGWERAWGELARRVEERGRAALAGGRPETARDDLMRAYNYHRAAEFFVRPSLPRKVEHYHRARSCFAAAGALADPPFEAVELPFEGTTLPGWFLQSSRRASGRTSAAGMAQPSDQRPTIVFLGGGDGSGEELYFISGAAAALRRGYHALLVEGPGQRGVLHRDPSLVQRPDYEVVVSAVLDALLARPEVDPARVALHGISLGGYTGARAAAADHRVAALVLNSPMTSLHRYTAEGLRRWTGGVPASALDAAVRGLARVSPTIRFGYEQFQWILGEGSMGELLDRMRAFDLGDAATRITCPVLCLSSTGESAELQRQSRDFYAALDASRTWRGFGADEGADGHCQINNLVLSHQVYLDWLDATLGGCQS